MKVYDELSLIWQVGGWGFGSGGSFGLDEDFVDLFVEFFKVGFEGGEDEAAELDFCVAFFVPGANEEFKPLKLVLCEIKLGDIECSGSLLLFLLLVVFAGIAE